MSDRLPVKVLCALLLSGCTDGGKPAPAPAPAPEPSPPASASTPAPAPTPKPAPEPELEPEREPKPIVVSPLARPLHEGRVLIASELDPRWAEGPILKLADNTYHEKWQVERTAALDRLPPELRSFAGMRMDLYGPAGRLCTVVLDSLIIEAHTPMTYGDNDYVRSSGEELWPKLNHFDAVLLVGSFAADEGCDGAIWARDASLPAPMILHPGGAKAHRKLVAAERKRLLESEQGKQLEREYLAYVAHDKAIDPELENPPWSEFSRGRGEVWLDDQGVARLLTFVIGHHSFAPCAEVPEPAHTLARLVGGELMFPDGIAIGPPPVAVFDADLDGRFELVFHEDGGDYVIVQILSETADLRIQLSLPDNSHVWC